MTTAQNRIEQIVYHFGCHLVETKENPTTKNVETTRKLLNKFKKEELHPIAQYIGLYTHNINGNEIYKKSELIEKIMLYSFRLSPDFCR